jgi:hypothetical protein
VVESPHERIAGRLTGLIRAVSALRVEVVQSLGLRRDAYGLWTHADTAGAWNLLGLKLGRWLGLLPCLPNATGTSLDGGDACWRWNDQDRTQTTVFEQSWSPDRTSVGEPAGSQPGNPLVRLPTKRSDD